MPAAPVVAKKLTGADSPGALEAEMMRKCNAYRNNVDKSRSELNLSWQRDGLPLEEAIERRIGELNLKRSLRSDAVRAEGFVVSCGSADLAPDRAVAFLREANDWFDRRYGSENTLSWAIHLDEGVPHLHRWQVPAITGKEGEFDRVSAKELFSPKSLAKLQQDFHEEVSSRYGFDRPLTKEERQESGVHYAGLPAMKAKTEAQQAEAERARELQARKVTAARHNTLKRSCGRLAAQESSLKRTTVNLAVQKNAVQAQLVDARSALARAEADREDAEKKAAEARIRAKGWERAVDNAESRCAKLDEQISSSRDVIDQLDAAIVEQSDRLEDVTQQILKLEKEKDALDAQVGKLRGEVSDLKEEKSILEKAVEKLKEIADSVIERLTPYLVNPLLALASIWRGDDPYGIEHDAWHEAMDQAALDIVLDTPTQLAGVLDAAVEASHDRYMDGFDRMSKQKKIDEWEIG